MRTRARLRAPPDHFHPDDVARAGIFGHLATLAYEKVGLLEAAHERWRALERVIQSRSRLMRGFSHDVKNAIGAIFLFAGFLMLFLPGQGVLTMLIGISMLDFPGKRRVEATLIGQPTVLSVINGMRGKFGKPPLIIAPGP